MADRSSERALDSAQLKSWYNEFYWSKGRKPSIVIPRDYFQFIECLNAEPGRSLLDVGAGGGLLLKAALDRGLKVFGVDLSTSGIALARSYAPGAQVVVGNGEQLPFTDSSFDYLTCLGSLEHFLNIETGLKEMVRVCKASARVCIMVPNSFYLFDIIGVLKKGYSRRGTFQPQEKLATRGEWQDLLEAYGLTVFAVYRDKEPIDTSWRNLFRDLHPIRIVNRFIEKILQAVMPLNLGYQFIFVCRSEKSR